MSAPNGLPPATNGMSISESTVANGPIPETGRDLPPAAIELAAKLFDMARRGQIEQLTPYLNAGIPSNIRNSAGDSLLMLACYHNQPRLASLLISRGADPDLLNDKGQSCIAGAVFKGYDDVVKVLVEEGKADIRAGQPNAVDCSALFRRWDAAKIMGVEEEARRLGPVLNPVGLI